MLPGFGRLHLLPRLWVEGAAEGGQSPAVSWAYLLRGEPKSKDFAFMWLIEINSPSCSLRADTRGTTSDTRVCFSALDCLPPWDWNRNSRLNTED